MNLRLSRVGVAALIVCAVFCIGLVLVLLPKFGGPGLDFANPYQVKVSVPDIEELEAKSVVLSRGVKVGTIHSIDVTGDRAILTLDIDHRYVPIHRDASIRVGQRTAVGDAYLDLGLGSARSGSLPKGGIIRDVRDTVEFDEAFTAFDERSRAAAASTLRSVGTGAADPRSPERWSGTVGGLSQTVHELRGISETLIDQRSELSRLVSGSRVTLHELGSRTQAINALVAAGQKTLGAFARNRHQFESGLAELPQALASARRALDTAHPLLTEARPFVNDLSAASPDIQGAFRDAAPTAAAARATLTRLAPFNHTAIPFLQRALPVVDTARPFSRALEPVLQNLVPSMQWLSPRAPELASWFSNTGSIGAQHDTKGHWVRFLIFQDTPFSEGLKSPAVTSNAYPLPGDEANPQPYKPGSYQRLLPYMPTP